MSYGSIDVDLERLCFFAGPALFEEETVLIRFAAVFFASLGERLTPGDGNSA